MEKKMTITIDLKGNMEMKSEGMTTHEMVGLLEVVKSQLMRNLIHEEIKGDKAK